MQAAFQRTLRSGSEYERFFPTSQLERTDPVVIKSGDTFDTIALMAKLARQYQSDTAGIAPLLRGKTKRDTCRNVWEFAYRHFQYTPDASGIEQLRRPLRAWADRRAGIDCDCYSILVSTILLNLGIPHALRKTKYNGRPDYQHIYVVVPDGSSHYTIDPVTDEFDKEVPYSEKFDKMMPIQVLNGPADEQETTRAFMPRVPTGSYGQFGFGAEMVGLVSEAEQVRQQVLATIRTVSLQGLASLASTDVLPSQEQIAELANVTGQTKEEATADIISVAHLSASFIERQRQFLLNQVELLDKLTVTEPRLVVLRGRLALILANWDNEAERTRLFEVLGAQEDAEMRAAGLSGLGSWISDIGDAFSTVNSAAGSTISHAASSVGQSANWVYNTVLTPVGQSISQAASWVGNTVAAGANAVAQGIKNSVVWLGQEAIKLTSMLMKFNPVSALIRTGLRMVFRVNMFHMSGRLGHGFFSEQQVRAKGFDVEEWKKVRDTLGKVLFMWDGLGGDMNSVRDAIMVGYQSSLEVKIGPTSSLPTELPATGPLLSNGLKGLGALGEAASGGAAVVAAGTCISTIIAWLGKIDWGKVVNTAATVAEKLAAKKAYDAVPTGANLVLPSSEQEYLANKAKFENQTSDTGSLALPVAIGVAVVGYFLFNEKPK